MALEVSVIITLSYVVEHKVSIDISMTSFRS